jgi:hypothetical protein
MPPAGEAQQHIRAPLANRSRRNGRAGLASQLRHPTNIRREQLSKCNVIVSLIIFMNIGMYIKLLLFMMKLLLFKILAIDIFRSRSRAVQPNGGERITLVATTMIHSYIIKAYYQASVNPAGHEGESFDPLNNNFGDFVANFFTLLGHTSSSAAETTMIAAGLMMSANC